MLPERKTRIILSGIFGRIPETIPEKKTKDPGENPRGIPENTSVIIPNGITRIVNSNPLTTKISHN